MERSKPAHTLPSSFRLKNIAAPAESRRGRKPKSNQHLTQAGNREHYRFDFQNEMALIGAELRRLRTGRGHSIVSAAKAAKISKYRLACIEHGVYIHFGLPDLYSLAELYGVSAMDIVSIIPGTNFEALDAGATLPGP